MRIFNVVATVAALGVAGAAPALAEEHIRVTGEGRVSAAPDMATVTLGVISEGTTAGEAMGANGQAMRKVMEALTGAGLETRDVQTSGLTLNPVYADPPQGSAPDAGPRIRGFQAQNMVTLRVRALDNLGAVLDAAVNSGANNLYGVSFGLQNPEARLDEARKAAVADARRKAELYAAAAGVTLGAVESIDEQGSGGGMPMPQMRASFAKEADTPVAGGEVDLNANVEVVYDIAPAK